MGWSGVDLISKLEVAARPLERHARLHCTTTLSEGTHFALPLRLKKNLVEPGSCFCLKASKCP